MTWVAGKRPEQHISQLEEGDVVVVTLPGGREARYKVQSVYFDREQSQQITIVLED